jgi:predicted phosphoribosyltransferase
MNTPFANRTDAGRLLADTLSDLPKAGIDTLVLALPRGGVPVAAPVARALGAGLDLMIVRKLGTPHNPELAMGAIASGDILVRNDDVIAAAGVDAAQFTAVMNRELQELRRRQRVYRGDRPYPALKGRGVVLVDDGVATGATMFAAIEAVRRQQPAQLVVAVPVAPPEVVARLRQKVDRVVCLQVPEPFFAIGNWYQDFSQTGDDEVRSLLAESWRGAKGGEAAG